jgi:hypothetical protein
LVTGEGLERIVIGSTTLIPATARPTSSGGTTIAYGDAADGRFRQQVAYDGAIQRTSTETTG